MATYGWHPKTGEQQVFATPEQREAEGYLDYHPDDEAKRPAGHTKGHAKADKATDTEKDPPLSRAEVIAALTEGNVPFNPEATDIQLDNALKGALRKALAAREIKFEKSDSTRKLLELVRTPPAAPPAA